MEHNQPTKKATWEDVASSMRNADLGKRVSMMHIGVLSRSHMLNLRHCPVKMGQWYERHQFYGDANNCKEEFESMISLYRLDRHQQIGSADTALVHFAFEVCARKHRPSLDLMYREGTVEPMKQLVYPPIDTKDL